MMRAFLASSRTAVACIRRGKCEQAPRKYFVCMRRCRMYIACNLQHHPSAFVSQTDSAGKSNRVIHTFISGVARCQSSISVPAQTSRMDSIEQILEAELTALRLIVPELNQEKHKGQAGKIAVIGGCKEYTGAPYFAAISALKIGADLSHVMCSKEAGPVIKSYSPELIVHPILRENGEANVNGDAERREVVAGVIREAAKWLPRFDCLVIGPGLGRDPLLTECVTQLMRDARKANIPMVIDGDGLSIVTAAPELVRGYPLAILTPNVNEHRRLAAALAGGDEEEVTGGDPSEQLRLLSEKLGNVTIVQKGFSDLISDGYKTVECSVLGSPRRCGGQGDILAGSIAVFMGWARAYQSREPSEESLLLQERGLSRNPGVLAAYAGCLLLRRAAMASFKRHKRSMVTTNVIEELGESMEELFPLGETTHSRIV